MATLSLLCRLKVLSFVSSVASSNELSRSLLIKTSNENERSYYPRDHSSDDILEETNGYKGHRCRSRKEDWLERVARDVPRYELSRRILLNEGKNTLCVKVREYSEREQNVQKTYLLDKRSWIISQYPLAKIYHTWTFSKDPCPSARFFCSSVRKLSNSALKLYSFADDPIREKFSSYENSSYRMIVPYHENVRRYSSCKKESKSKDCPVQEKQQLFQDICSEKKPDTCGTNTSLKECSESSRPCKPCVDPQPICSTPPCPNIQDYCPEKESHKEKFWRALSCFVALPLVLIMSLLVYSRHLEESKKPRPEFQDVPWMRRIVKPFPWGDGRHSLFHNPYKNPISPHGYEVEDPNAPRKTEQQQGKEN